MGLNVVGVVKYGECHYSKPFEKDESEIKVTEVEWKTVPISKTSTRVRLGIVRGALYVLTLGLS
jgi:hypothetical protein